MFISLTNPSKLRRKIAQTKSKLSAGFDLSQNALEVLSHIFNQSLLSGKFITTSKEAKIVYKQKIQGHV